MYQYRCGGHSKYSLKVHLIFVTKYRKSLFCNKRVLWSDGYFTCSIGQVSQDVIEKYILTQG